MSTEVNWTKIGELAKSFKDAVDAKIKDGPAAVSVEQVKEVLGDDATEERVNQMIENSKEIEFMKDATQDELFTLLAARLGTDEKR